MRAYAYGECPPHPNLYSIRRPSLGTMRCSHMFTTCPIAPRQPGTFLVVVHLDELVLRHLLASSFD